MAEISVIIPVFNTEQYLDRCLDSVLGQDLEDLEVICVDDVSTDGSAALIQRRARKDSRLRYIRQCKHLMRLLIKRHFSNIICLYVKSRYLMLIVNGCLISYLRLNDEWISANMMRIIKESSASFRRDFSMCGYDMRNCVSRSLRYITLKIRMLSY